MRDQSHYFSELIYNEKASRELNNKIYDFIFVSSVNYMVNIHRLEDHYSLYIDGSKLKNSSNQYYSSFDLKVQRANEPQNSQKFQIRAGLMPKFNSYGFVDLYNYQRITHTQDWLDLGLNSSQIYGNNI